MVGAGDVLSYQQQQQQQVQQPCVCVPTECHCGSSTARDDGLVAIGIVIGGLATVAEAYVHKLRRRLAAANDAPPALGVPPPPPAPAFGGQPGAPAFGGQPGAPPAPWL